MVGHGRERTDVDSRPGVSTVVAERDPGQTAIPCWQVDAAFTVGRELASKAAADAARGARIAAQKSRSSGLDERRAPVRAARAGGVADLVKAVVHHPRIAACRRSEERRVGKECRSRGAREQEKKERAKYEDSSI